MVDEADDDHDEVDEQGTVIIAGIGRFGQIVNRLVQSAGFETVVVDNNLATVQMMRKFGFRGFFVDPTRPDLLNAAGLEDARVLVVAIDDKPNAVKLVRYARKHALTCISSRVRATVCMCMNSTKRAPMISCVRCSTARYVRAGTLWKTSADGIRSLRKSRMRFISTTVPRYVNWQSFGSRVCLCRTCQIMWPARAN